MKASQMVRYTLEAIYSVRKRATKAMQDCDYREYSKLMGDLYSLEVVLVQESQRMLDEEDKAA